MKNWAQEENNAMRGYILYAAKLLNGNENVISDDALKGLFKFLGRATDDLTADEAQAYYINSNF